MSDDELRRPGRRFDWSNNPPLEFESMPPPASYQTAEIASISATPLLYPFCAVDPELEGVEEVAVEEEPGLSSGHPLSALISMHPSHQWSVDQLQALASDFGLVLASRPALRASLAHSVGQRLVSRAAGAIYQGAGYSLQNIPLNYATQIFPAECLVDTGSSSCTTWRLETREHMLACFPPLLAESGYICGGLTRMLKRAHGARFSPGSDDDHNRLHVSPTTVVNS